MRQGNRTVFTSCHAPLSQAKKYVAVQLLTKEVLYCVVEVKGKIHHVMDQLGIYLGIKDTCLFGLALLAGDEYRFLNQETKVSKIVPKQWKSLNNAGLDGTGKPLVTLMLRIQFYVDCHLFIRDKVTRMHYYLQLRENVLKHSQSSLEEHYFLLCAYALQADMGNYLEDKFSGQYFEPKEYFPPWVLERIGEEYIIQNIPAMHKDNQGMSRTEAQTAFIREASSADAPHNLHLYELLRKKNDPKSSIWLGICPKGIEIYENNDSSVKQLWSTFLWGNINKLCFEKKKFEIRAMSYSDTRKYTYYAGSDEKAKYLLYLCRSTHQFSMIMQPKVEELQQRERQAKKSYRESYIYSDSFDFEWEQEHGSLNMSLRDFSTLPKAGKTMSDQRISVISNASSNTTSGIVSDKVQSLDGSEDDLEMEIMINSPPAPSLESLSLAPQFDCEDLDGSNLYSSKVEMNLPPENTDFEEVQLNENASAISSLPSTAHSKTSSNTASRTDSSSSQHSASTVKSRYQRGKADVDSLRTVENHFHCSDVAADTSSIYFLPKMDTTGFWASTPAPHMHNGSDDSQRVHETKDIEFPVQATFSNAQKINPMQSSTAQVCHPKPATSRILTSIGGSSSSPAQAPLVHPPHMNLHLPHGRTKIGVSSLSRPAVNVSSTSRKTANCFPTASSYVHIPPRTNVSRSHHHYYQTAQNASLPSPLYYPVTSKYYNQAAAEVRGRSHSEDGFFFSRMGMSANLAVLGSSLESSLFQHLSSDNLPLRTDIASHYHDNSESSLQDFMYIPPPPLYANPLPGSPMAGSYNLSGFNIPTTQPIVTRARSVESCNSFDSLLSEPNACVGRAQSMDRRSKSEYLNNLLPPPPLYLSKLPGDGLQVGSNEILNRRVKDDPNKLPSLDIDKLRRRSKDLDLPLISALCNDRSLMPFTPHLNSSVQNLSQRQLISEPSSKTCVQSNSRPLSWHVSSDVQLPLAALSQCGSSQWSLPPFSSVVTSFGKSPTSSSAKTSPVNTLQSGPQLFPLKLSVSGYNNASPRNAASKLNGIDISVA